MPAAALEVRLICLAVADCFPVCFVFFFVSTMFGGSMIVTMVVLIVPFTLQIKMIK